MNKNYKEISERFDKKFTDLDDLIAYGSGGGGKGYVERIRQFIFQEIDKILLEKAEEIEKLPVYGFENAIVKRDVLEIIKN